MSRGLPARAASASVGLARITVFALASVAGHALADTPQLASELTPARSTELSRLVHEIVLAHLPREYENTKQWGGTKEVWDGLRISVDGFRVRTKRRKKQANHGTWKRYKAWLIDPGENLHLRIDNLRQTADDRAAFDLEVVARLGAFGRLSQWERDVQLYSLSVDAESRVTLTLRCDMGFRLDFEHFPPDLLIDPVVRNAELRLDEFRLRRISNLHGPLVKQLGRSLHDVLQQEIERRRTKLVAKLNRQIDDRRDRLRFSVAELLEEQQLADALRGLGVKLDQAVAQPADG